MESISYHLQKIDDERLDSDVTISSICSWVHQKNDRKVVLPHIKLTKEDSLKGGEKTQKIKIPVKQIMQEVRKATVSPEPKFNKRKTVKDADIIGFLFRNRKYVT